MKKSELKQIIKEEIIKILNEAEWDYFYPSGTKTAYSGVSNDKIITTLKKANIKASKHPDTSFIIRVERGKLSKAKQIIKQLYDKGLKSSGW